MRIVTWTLLLVLALTFLNPLTVRADTIVHTVQPGENLFRIGLKYGVAWQDIVAANGLTSTKIYVGQQLQIPNGTDSTAAPAVAVAVTAPVAAVAAQPESAATHPSTYTIARGDTLGSIARRFGVGIQALMAANRISNQDRIYSGQVLTIPGGSNAAATTVEVAAPVGVTPASKLIRVDISEQHMYVYENGGLIGSWVTSTGERGRDTAPGNYSVLNKIPNAYGATWDLWMPNWLGIYWAGYLQNGIHALPILSDGSQLWAGWLGTPVSFGCVVLSDENSTTLYNWAEVGTPVQIQW